MIVGVAGITYIIYIFPTLRALDHGEPLPGRAIIGEYFFLIFLFLFGSGGARLKERNSKIFDNVLIILVCLVLVPYILYKMFYSA